MSVQVMEIVRSIDNYRPAVNKYPAKRRRMKQESYASDRKDLAQRRKESEAYASRQPGTNRSTQQVQGKEIDNDDELEPEISETQNQQIDDSHNVKSLLKQAAALQNSLTEPEHMEFATERKRITNVT